MRWKHYLPAAMMALLGFLFLAVPQLAVFLVVSALFSLALMYAYIVYQFHRGMRVGMRPETEPSFRNVSVTVFQRFS